MPILTHWLNVRLSSQQLRGIRVAKRAWEHRISDLVRALFTAMTDDKSRSALLRILKKYIPETACWVVMSRGFA